MANEVGAGQEPEQIAGAEKPEQTAETVISEQATGQPDKYVSAGEFGRRMGKIEDRMTEMLNRIAYQQAMQAQTVQQRPVPAQQNVGIPTDDELWSRAQGGDRDAFIEHQRRISAREYEARQQTTGRQNMVEVQLSALAQKYPVLNDSSHPLTQKASTAYQLLVNNGYAPGRATLLEAAKTAIADSPDLVSDIYSQGSQAREHARQSGVRSAQSGVTGASYRNEPAPRREGSVRETSPDEAALARRMGIKDPKASKERFLKRQQEGQSTIDPRMLPIVERSMEQF